MNHSNEKNLNGMECKIGSIDTKWIMEEMEKEEMERIREEYNKKIIKRLNNELINLEFKKPAKRHKICRVLDKIFPEDGISDIILDYIPCKTYAVDRWDSEKQEGELSGNFPSLECACIFIIKCLMSDRISEENGYLYNYKNECVEYSDNNRETPKTFMGVISILQRKKHIDIGDCEYNIVESMIDL